MKAVGQWNAAWDPFLELDPAWTDEFMATDIGIYGTKVFTPKEIELLRSEILMSGVLSIWHRFVWGEFQVEDFDSHCRTSLVGCPITNEMLILQRSLRIVIRKTPLLRDL
jgi:hypothetical protein